MMRVAKRIRARRRPRGRPSPRIRRVSTPEDFDLTTIQVRAAQNGDRAAMDDLFRRYLPRVTRIVAARLGRGWRELGLDDDIVQETFLDALAALNDGKIKDEAAFCSWLARCVQNNVQDQLRHGRAVKRGGGDVDRFADLERSWLTESMLEGDDATPSQLATARETETQLEQALLSIDPRYREIICLRAYCHMPYAEVAASMGLPSENTANVLFLRARAELQKQLAKG
jgi:RNA polymerase sigma factor (sigma-70 family)